jgi:hypothetical protein
MSNLAKSAKRRILTERASTKQTIKGETMLIQQGDVLVIKVEKVIGKKLKHLTLAEGEVTGHSHKITEGEAELYEENGVLYLRVNSEKAVLTHEEHHAVEIPKGDYKIGIVREYDHFFEEARNVVD